MNFNFDNNDDYHLYSTPNSYTYVDGMGFTPPDYRAIEVKNIKKTSNTIGGILMLHVALSYFIPRLLLLMVQIMIPAIRILNQSVLAPSFVLYSIDIISYILINLIPFIIFSSIMNMPFSVSAPNEPLNKRIVVSAIGIALGASVVGGFSSNITTVFFNVIGFQTTMPNFSLSYDVLFSFFMFISIVILTPIFEELIFRGIILQSLRRFGDTFALITSSFIFAALHSNFIQSPNAFIMGIVIGYFVIRFSSLKIGIYIHFANNLLTLILNIIITQSIHGELYYYIINAIYIIFALIAIIYIMKKYNNVFTINKLENLSHIGYRIKVFILSPFMLIFLTFCLFGMITSLISIY